MERKAILELALAWSIAMLVWLRWAAIVARIVWAFSELVAIWRKVRRKNKEVFMASEDIKETLDFVKGSVKLGKFCAVLFADGIQAKDALALGEKIVSDEAFRTSLIEAVLGCQNIPQEMKDHHSVEDIAAIGETVLAALKE